MKRRHSSFLIRKYLNWKMSKWMTCQSQVLSSQRRARMAPMLSLTISLWTMPVQVLMLTKKQMQMLMSTMMKKKSKNLSRITQMISSFMMRWYRSKRSSRSSSRRSRRTRAQRCFMVRFKRWHQLRSKTVKHQKFLILSSCHIRMPAKSIASIKRVSIRLILQSLMRSKMAPRKLHLWSLPTMATANTQ